MIGESPGFYLIQRRGGLVGEKVVGDDGLEGKTKKAGNRVEGGGLCLCR